MTENNIDFSSDIKDFFQSLKKESNASFAEKIIDFLSFKTLDYNNKNPNFKISNYKKLIKLLLLIELEFLEA